MIEMLKVGDDGSVEMISVDHSQATLKAIQSAVEGYIEHVQLDGFDMWINEEGRYQFPERVNWLASDIAGFCGRVDMLLDPVRGPVIFSGVTPMGETASLPRKAWARIGFVVRDAGKEMPKLTATA